MSLNALQKYFLKIYAIVMLFFCFCVPTLKDGYVTYGFTFIQKSVGEVIIPYLVLEFIGITLAAAAILIAIKDAKKK